MLKKSFSDGYIFAWIAFWSAHLFLIANKMLAAGQVAYPAFPLLPRFQHTSHGSIMLMENHKLYSLATHKRMYVDDKERCHWRCTDRNCQGSGSTVRAEDDNSHHTPFISIHGHADICKWNQSTIVLNYYQNEVYRRFREDAAMVVDLHGHYSWAVTLLQVHYPALVQHFPAQIHFATTASRIRTSRVPPVPSRNQLPTLVVPDRWAFIQTYPGGRFLQHKDSHQGMHTMVFGTDECFTALCRTSKVFMDGTFFVCPVPFYQLFILHYLDGDRMIPALYVLLTAKTADIYTRFFVWLSAEATARGSPLQWTRARLDFENGMVAALRAPWSAGLPGGQIRIGHCFFHFCQALYRKLGDHHLQSHYKVLHLGVYGVVCKTMALAFLRPDRMQACLLAIRAEYAELPALNPDQLIQRPNMDPWFDYVYNCYVKDGATVAPREDWTVCDLDSFRTNNNLEGYHCKIKTRLAQQRPNMWKLISFLQDDARETAATVLMLANGQQVMRRSATYDSMNDRLQHLKMQHRQVPPIYSDLRYVTLCGVSMKTFV
jgi:hypothetical protein